MEGKRITLDVVLDETQLKQLQEIIAGNNGLSHLNLENDEDLKILCKSCLMCGIIREAQEARERMKN